jgi:protein-disulfide isomerase
VAPPDRVPLARGVEPRVAQQADQRQTHPLPMAIKDDNITRKERREQARAEREALERQQAAAAARKRRFAQLGGVLAVAVVAIVIIVVASGGGSAPKKLKAGQAVPGASQAIALFAGIPEQGPRLGNPKAPLTLGEYVDLQCPVCREYALSTFPSLVVQYVKTGKVQVVFHSLPVIQGPDGSTTQSQNASRFALAAGQQNQLFPFTELFYENQQQEGTGYLTTGFLQQIGGGITGLDVAAATKAANSAAVSAIINADHVFAAAHGANATPSFFLGRTGGPLGFLSSGALTLTDFAAAFKKLGVV